MSKATGPARVTAAASSGGKRAAEVSYLVTLNEGLTVPGSPATGRSGPGNS
jgi:hypothetical protein